MFGVLGDIVGPFTIDLMASDASVRRVPGSGVVLSFFSRCDCEGSGVVDTFAKNVLLQPGSGGRAFGYCFPPPVVADHVVQHLAECNAHAGIVVQVTTVYWFPRVQQAAVRSRIVAPANAQGIFSATWPGRLPKRLAVPALVHGGLRSWFLSRTYIDGVCGGVILQRTREKYRFLVCFTPSFGSAFPFRFL